MNEEVKNVSVAEVIKIGVAQHVFNLKEFSCCFNHDHAIAVWSKKYDLVLLGKEGLNNATARELISELAIQNGCTHILFLDADHIIPVEMLDLLMESRNEAMVSGLVCKKGEGYKQVAFGMTNDGSYIELTLPLDGRIYDVAVCAFGCTLINLSKLQKLDKPWFRDTCDNFKGVPTNIRSDVNLCNAFRLQLKEKVWIDTRILVGHSGVKFANVVYPQNAVFMKNLVDLYNDSVLLRENQKGSYGRAI
jgi:hypothetical protein